MRSSNLPDHFSALKDPRQSWKTVYLLEEVLLIVLAGVMAGADDFVEISYRAGRKLAFLRRFLPFREGIPSHDTLNDVMNALPDDLFAECFTNWVAALRDGDGEIVAIDGKTSRRAGVEDGRSRPHLGRAEAHRRLKSRPGRCGPGVRCRRGNSVPGRRARGLNPRFRVRRK